MKVYYDPRLVAGSQLEQPVTYAGDQAVEVLDTISNGEVVSHRFEIQV